MILEVMPEVTGTSSHSTIGLEIIVGDNQLLADDAKVLDAGIA